MHKYVYMYAYSPNVVTQALPMPSGVAPTTSSAEPMVCSVSSMETQD